ncbi:MAG: Sir2 family NAD-dependent protein deacetylase [Burkholderiales bacterium]
MSDIDLQDALDHAADLLDQADALIVAAGAGMGVDSGLPDFRGNQGFWRAYPALGRRGLSFTEVANPKSFINDPALAWGFYGHRLDLYRRTVPHAGFETLRRWGQAMPHGAWVFTSNVDGQFQRAGFDAQRIAECHGSIHHLQCLAPCTADVWPADAFEPAVNAQACALTNEPPTCPRCGAIARPNILMFGDWAWVEKRAQAQEARLAAWLSKIERPVVLELGAGTAIPSVRHFSQRMVHSHGARLVRINPAEFSVPTRMDVGLPVGALAGVTLIDAARGRSR